MKNLLIVLISLPVLLSAQTETQKWGKADISYQMNSINIGRSNGIESGSISDIIVSSLTNVYWIFISDVDGDNCSFSPTCSSFFVESVKETNLIQGTLMFADRLTRDTNFIDRQHRYPIASNGRLYDIPSSYKLDPSAIKYIPPFVSINDE